jgi:hypothetical protein
MSRFTRFVTASAVAVVVAVAPLSAAVAQDEDDSVGHSGGTGTVTVPTVLDNSVNQDPGPTAAPPASTAPAASGSLPFTGGDVAGFAVVGGSLLGAGTLAVVAGRRRRD